MAKDLDQLALDLAHARVAMENLAHLDPNARGYHEAVASLVLSVRALDNGKAFEEIDERTGYEEARDMIARVKSENNPHKDPAEWGDLSGFADYDATLGSQGGPSVQ